MRIAVIGAGAVGSYFGGKLAQIGNDVTFLARGRHLEALRQRPLRVESIAGDFEVKVHATNSPEAIGPVDAVFIAVKAWQVPQAACVTLPLLNARAVVVPLQNGIDAPQQLMEVLGPDHVVGGLCKIIAYVVGPGHIRHAGAEPYVAFGELKPPSSSERLEKIQHEFLRTGVTCEIPADVTAAMWQKFVFIASTSGLGALTRLPIGDLRGRAEIRAQLERAMAEIVAVGRASGVNLPDDTIVRTLAYVDSLPPNGTSSMQRDIMEGRPSELESQTGTIVRLGQALGVPTPTHAAIYRALLPVEQQARRGHELV